MDDNYKVTTIRMRPELWDRMIIASDAMSRRTGIQISKTMFIAEAINALCEKYEQELSTQST